MHRILALVLVVIFSLSSVNLPVLANTLIDEQNQTEVIENTEVTSVEEEQSSELDDANIAVSEGVADGEGEDEAEDITEAVLQSDVLLTLYQDEEGSYFIDLEMTVQETAFVDVENVSVKVVLPAGLSISETDLETLGSDENVTVINSVSNEVEEELAATAIDSNYEMLLDELATYSSDILASYGEAVIWENQTISANGSKTYALTLEVDEEVYDFDSIGLYFVNGSSVDEDAIELVESYAVNTMSAESEANENGISVASDGDDNNTLTSSYDGTALLAYADELMEEYGLKLSIIQSPAGGNTVLAGSSVTWYVTITIPTAESYSEFNSYNKTLWNSYDDLSVTLTAPDGITIVSVTASGYACEVDENGDSATVNFGDITANSQTISFSVVGYIDADPAPATGTTYTLTEDDITYSTNITVLDRDSNNAEVKTYTVTGSTSTNLSNFTLTSTTEDFWTLTKTQKNCVANEDGSLEVTYIVELLMNDYTQTNQYGSNGRVKFDSFSIVDTPTITDEDGNTYTPISVTAVNDTTKEETSGTTSITITDYAVADDVDLETTSAFGRPLDGDVPVYTTYTVTAVYDATQFESEFYDVIEYTTDNEAVLNYTLDYADDTTPVTGSDTKTATGDYSYSQDPATINLNKVIDSIYSDEAYSGNVSFSLFDDAGSAANIYALMDSDGDGTTEYVQISNIVTITRDSNRNSTLYVTVSSTGDSVTYTGLLYLSAGSYSIKETGNTIANTSFSKFTADSGVTLTEVDNETYSFTLAAGQATTINAYNTETRGSIVFNKSAMTYDGTITSALSGVTFGLYSDDTCTTPVTDDDSNAITAISDSQGVVTFAKVEPGTYYIKETETVSGYLLDASVYTVEVTANQTTTTFIDGTGTVYNQENSASITFVKYLLSVDADGNIVQTAVDSTKLGLFTDNFILQYSTDGNTWFDKDTTITLQRDYDSSTGTWISSATIEGLPVYTDSSKTILYQYRIVETLPSGYSLATCFTGDINATSDGTAVTTDSFTLEDGDATVSLTNQPTGEISVYKEYVRAGSAGATSTNAKDDSAVTVYLLTKNDDGSYTYVNSAITGNDGVATITGVNLLTGTNSGTAQVYYWAEAISNDAYSAYTLKDGETVTVDVNGVLTDMWLLNTAVYASAYDSTDSKTTLTNILPYVRVKLYKESTSGSYVSGAGYTVYRVVDDVEESTAYTATLAENTKGTIADGGTTLVLEAGYTYHIYETTVPTNYTGPTNAEGSNANGDGYITIDLTNAVPTSTESDGVKQGTYAATATFIDEPYPELILSKTLTKVEGTTVSTENYAATFYVYRATEQDGIYTLYSNSYEANTTVSLEAGYYYAFVEVDSTGDVVAPEIYPGTSEAVDGAALMEITLSDGTTAYAYVTDSKLEAGSTTYTIETVTNYSTTSSVTVTKYAYNVSGGNSATLSGAVIGIYTDADCTTKVGEATTNANGQATFTGLDIYDDNGEKITYYVKEIDAPENYFESETVLTAQLTAGEVTTLDVNHEALCIYDEPELTVNIPVIWTDYDLDATTMSSYLLEGATVYLYKAVYDEDGETILYYEYVESSTSVYDGIDSAYATFSGLRHNQDYVFVLGMSGVTDEGADNYPLFASINYTDDYVGETAPGTLTADQLGNYQYIEYNNTNITARTDTTDDSLNNYLLHLEIDIQKYCLKDHGTAKLITLDDGTTAWYVNGAMFYLYRQKLTDEELTTLAAGGSVEFTYDATDLERVSADTTSSGGTADLEDVYDDTYVYWLIEATTGTGHTWATGTSYYRVLLYPEVLAENNGSVSATNATSAQSFNPTETVKFEVENTCGSGSHQYMIATIFMNKWAGDYDQYGEKTEDYKPMNGVSFQYSLSGTTNSFVLSGAENQTTEGEIAIQYGETADEDGNTQADNDAGQVSTRFKFAEILDQWYVAIAQDAGLNVTYITDITTSSNNLADLANYTEWNKWAGMLYVASSADAGSMDDLTDLTENNGEAAMRILHAFADAYPTCTITAGENGNSTYVSYMENILCEFGLKDGLEETTYLYTYYHYYSYYAHIEIEEIDNGDYEDLTDTYDVYLQFRPTNGNGLANIKYFYLDNVVRDDYYYDSDPTEVGTMGLDAALDNTERTQIINMPTLNFSLTVTKYGYTLTTATQDKTDDELDTYYSDEGEGESTELKPLVSTFILQRYDSTEKTWKYYSADSCEYVSSASNAQFTTDSNGQFSTTLPLGYYCLIEVSVTGDKNYEVVLDGTDVIAEDGATAKAIRYFWITSANNGKNTVNIYDPQSADLYIEKYSLSGTKITSGVTITLTDTADKTKVYTAEWDTETESYKISNLPSGTYTVTEEVTNTSVTDEYFQSFTITIDYSRSATKETAEQDSSVTEYDTYVSGLSVSMSGEVKCTAGSKDTIAGNVTGSGASATLTIHNPSTGSITITKTDANDSSTTLSEATFTLYYHKFTVSSADAYVAANTTTAPTFTEDNPTSNGWTLWGTTDETNNNGTVSVSDLTPGWYAIVETSAPSDYEADAATQFVAVTTDMNSTHTLTDNGNIDVIVEDTKKVSLGVTKVFNLEDFSSDLSNEAQYYSVTFGLYVYDTISKTYIPAYSLGLTTTDSVTVHVTDTTSKSGYAMANTGYWDNLIQIEDHLENGVYTIAKNNVTYALDGNYYIKETAVINTSTNESIAEDWWISDVEISSGSSLTVSSSAQGGYYYKVSGFKDNATGTVTFTNSLSYLR